MKFSKFLELFKEGKVGAESHIRNLIEMAMVDGHLDSSEKKLLNDIAKKYGLSSVQLKSIEENPNSIEFEIPIDEAQKFEQLYDLVHMMVVDGYIDRDEIRICGVFARKFGYKESKSDELIDAVANNIKNGQSLKDTKRRVDWLLN